MRDADVDEAIEEQFGKPDFTKSFIKEGVIWTPIGKWKLWRVDELIFRKLDE